MLQKRKHVDKTVSELPEGKLALQLFAGSASIALGMWIAGNIEMVIGMTSIHYYGSFLFALALILLGGWVWSKIAQEIARSI